MCILYLYGILCYSLLVGNVIVTVYRIELYFCKYLIPNAFLNITVQSVRVILFCQFIVILSCYST